MKRITLIFSAILFFSAFTFAQVQQGDIKIVQQYFGVEKAALVKEYMDLTPSQDSVFWKDYNAYETSRQELGQRRIMLVDKYFKDVTSLNADNATELVNEANSIDIAFKKLQMQYYKKMSKTVGQVKAAQFYQLEAYLNNIINLGIQENIPFVGEIEQMRKQK